MATPSEARIFAVLAHADQLYGDQPYAIHLDAVATLAAPFGEQAQIIAYLHDVVEDTSISIEIVHQQFGELVAECVGLLTDAPGANRKERKTKTYRRLALVSGAAELALVVKAADRLANVSACVADGKLELWETYKNEHPVFRASTYREDLCNSLWKRLDELLISWPQHEGDTKMLSDSKPDETFGCEHCCPCDTNTAWEASGTLTREVNLIDKSHFRVMILKCPACNQSFIFVFTETIDWEDGEDPQYWTILPLTQKETADVVHQGSSLTEAKLNSLGPHRQSLRRDHPKAEPPHIYWATGILVRPYD